MLRFAVISELNYVVIANTITSAPSFDSLLLSMEKDQRKAARGGGVYGLRVRG